MCTILSDTRAMDNVPEADGLSPRAYLRRNSTAERLANNVTVALWNPQKA
jgi:hypothetical protein